jgi:protein-tyrosine phosphatase
VTTVLFICTGNIFRSLVAEYALKAALGPTATIVAGSAGIQASPQTIHPIILQRLVLKGANPSNHRQRKLTHELLQAADLPVAMGLDHQEYVRVQFAKEILLFNQICYERNDPVLDIHEAITDWHVNMDAACAYALSLVDYIWEAMPAFLEGLERLKKVQTQTDQPLRHD